MSETAPVNAELFAAIVSAQAEMPMVGKSGSNLFDKYTYAKLEDYVRAVRPIFAKYGLAMLTSVEAVERLPNRTTAKGGTEYGAQVRIALTIVHKSGQSITTASFGEGQDRADKSIYKAITGARKYALASALGLATSDDPEEEGPPADPPAAQRTTPPKPSNGTANGHEPPKRDLRRDITVAVKQWSGLNMEDVPSALVKLKAACGVTSQVASDLELTTMLGFIEKNKAAKFVEVCP